jgi:hypothetical protein
MNTVKLQKENSNARLFFSNAAPGFDFMEESSRQSCGRLSAIGATRS